MKLRQISCNLLCNKKKQSMCPVYRGIFAVKMFTWDQKSCPLRRGCIRRGRNACLRKVSALEDVRFWEVPLYFTFVSQFMTLIIG